MTDKKRKSFPLVMAICLLVGFLFLLILLFLRFQRHQPHHSPVSNSRQPARLADFNQQPRHTEQQLATYLDPGRDAWQQPDRVVKALRLRPGQVVADIGCGSGYFTFRLAKAVLPTGKVYAVDSDPNAIEFIQKQATVNIDVILDPEGDALPGIAPGSLDLAFFCEVHLLGSLADPANTAREDNLEALDRYFSLVHQCLKPNGKLAYIEKLPQTDPVNSLSAEDTIKIITGFGGGGRFSLKSHQTLPRQMFLIFKRL